MSTCTPDDPFGGHFCSGAPFNEDSYAHPKDPQIEYLKQLLPVDHLLYTFVIEHEHILRYIAEFQDLNTRIQKLKTFESGQGELKLLEHLANHLLAAEPHCQREEKVLSTALQKCGVSAPLEEIHRDHQELRVEKQALKALLKSPPRDLEDLKRRVSDSAKFFAQKLSAHLHRENHVLFPKALEVIQSPEEWASMKEACDQIGYCSFTPELD